MPSASATRCRTSLKDELRQLRHEERHLDASAMGGMQQCSTTESFDGDATTPTASPSTTAVATPERPIVIPSVQQNRFHMISDDGCCTLKQPSLKRVARSPTACGAVDASGGGSSGVQQHPLQKYTHVLVVDFECTCDSGEPNYPHEIIEFPVVVVDTATYHVVSHFHTYVKPTRNPVLTPFCTELTGIRQDQVQDAPTISEALALFDVWLKDSLLPLVAHSMASKRRTTAAEASSEDSEEKHLGQLYEQLHHASTATASSCAPLIFATDGPCDMRRFVYDCHVIRDGINFPPMFYRWVNVRRAFADHFRTKPDPLLKMLRRLGMQFHGQHHCGFDDAKNIARVLVALMQRGHRLQHVSTIPFLSPEMLACDRRASDLLEELGDDADIGSHRGARRPHTAGKSSGKKRR